MKSIIATVIASAALVSASLLLTQCNTSRTNNKFSDPELMKIAEFADHRTADSLIKYLKHKQPLLRVESAYALASVRDPKAVNELHVLMQDPVAEVRAAAAYALGQILHPSSVEPLSLRLNAESNEEAFIAIAEALGKIGGALRAASTAPEWTENAANALANMERSDSIGIHALAKGAFWLHNGGWDDTQLMNKLATCYPTQSTINRRMIAFAMARYRGNWYSDTLQVNRFISQLQQENDPLVVAVGVSVAGRAKTLTSADFIKQVILTSSDSRQLIAACRAAGNNLGIDAAMLLPLLHHSHPHIAEEACAALKNKTLDKKNRELVRIASQQMRPSLRAMVVRMLHQQGDTLRVNDWYNSIGQTQQAYDRVALIRALGVSGQSAVMCYREALQNADILQANAFAEAFIESHNQSDFPADIHYSESLLELIRRNDIGITALCAAELRNLQLTTEEKSILNDALLQALGVLTLPKEVETANEIIKTLNAWGISPREEIKPSFNHPIDWELVKSIPRHQRALIITNKGTIEIELHVEDAPGSVASFVKLCREGFYNGKAFHRVVPNFVIQGGCPRGDGMGGTDYTLRSEFRLHDYSTGAVGLASSGPDTESCQWFINHLPTPHLEGRYTIFAHVQKGLEVVDQITIGDSIERIEIVEE